ncbi:MAG: fluoride efflux transporter CrcB [Bacteroidia bacterium]
MNNIAFVFIGGGIGSLFRYGIAELFRNNWKSNFPVATLCSNVLSCIILALTVGYFAKADLNPGIKTFILVGICGGFSTFSTFSFETVELMRSGNLAVAISNVLISVIVCLALIWFIVK